MVDGIGGCMTRKPWELPFLAEPEELGALRRLLRLHLRLWGLADVIDAAEVCVTELVGNVIRHVGAGTPITLVVAMRDTHLRIALRDPDTRALPTLMSAGPEAEAGRGMTLVDAFADRWGVVLGAQSKLVWCDLSTRLASPSGHVNDPRVDKGEVLLSLYSGGVSSVAEGPGRVGDMVQEETAIDLIADLLHWLRAHGCDPDEALDRAQMHYEAEVTEAL
jgi:anti-sigma regulatory factor (Ser/Thr protein kinase)